ncbi:UvrD-helicase domain-containing protein [Marinicauda pacifica]|uniref:UvrD-helicase domain-containing protein n=1 Tax=Marinicauda pacifica TaxID=1133559 RepID=UPI0035C839CA
MTSELSKEQQDIVALPLKPLAVTACAGSGKTRTAVHRLLSMRQRSDGPGLIALLSFSNVAVDTFRREYAQLLRSLPTIGLSSRVQIDTMDGFITANILRPHGNKVMRCPRAPFLIDGREGFLNNFTVYDGDRILPTANIEVACEGPNFRYSIGRANTALPSKWAQPALARLGAVGAYSHSGGRYWALRVLREKPFLLRAMARRYPHILVDEAQDIGPEHQAILELLIGAGSQLSLIGDSNQAIYEFARANGAFIKDYSMRTGVAAHQLTVNFRSLPGIVAVANKLTGRFDTPNRLAQSARPGCYYMPFKPTERDKALGSFRSLLGHANIELSKAVVLCRSSEWVAEWSGEQGSQGAGVVRCFADAALSRDQRKDYYRAFNEACLGLAGLFSGQDGALLSRLDRPTDEKMGKLRRLIWSFVRDPDTGLPSATLVADAAWHQLLRLRTEALADRLTTEFGLDVANNLGQRLSKRKLESRPLFEIPDLAACQEVPLRTSTVHKVKGESLDAVLYLAKKSHVSALLGGPATEEGRIGYVALTRARDIFVLGVPETCLAELEPKLLAFGLHRFDLADASDGS